MQPETRPMEFALDMPTAGSSPTPASEVGRLLLLNGPEPGRTLEMPCLPCRIGRGGNSALIVTDGEAPPRVSREHATLRGAPDGLLVTDHSRNGTRVGTRWLRAEETARLPFGDTLQLGPNLRLRLEARGTASKAGPITALSMSSAQAAPVSPAAAPIYRQGQTRSFLLAPETLQAAWKRVALNRGAAGPDGVTIAEFTMDAEARLLRLREELRRGHYTPMPLRLFAAPKRNGGARVISILCVKDRIVQQALHAALQPFLEPLFPPCSFAYRPGVGTQQALRRVTTLLEQGLTWVAETDIANFFDSISHQILLDKLSAAVPDTFALSLAARCLASCASAPGRGLAQGAATSPLWSNLYLADFDRMLLAGGWQPARYGDDLVIPCPSRNRGQAVLAESEGFLRSRLELKLRAEKTALVPLRQGFTFLGFRFTETGREAAPEAVARLEERLRNAVPGQEEATRRGWRNYFGAEPGGAKREIPFTPDDEWITRFLTLFSGREGVYARLSGTKGSDAFVACAGEITPDLVRRHVAGDETLAAYPLREDGTVSVLVMDIDAVRKRGRPAGQGESNYELEPAHNFARDLAQVCRAYGVPAQREDSGQKGEHVWLFFDRPVSPEAARRLARLLALRAGFPRPGVRLEILPRHTEWPGPELGDAVKLPFGVHPVTGRRCFLLDTQGEPIADWDRALAGIRAISAKTVDAVSQKLAQGAGPPPEEARQTECGRSDPSDGAVLKLIQGCSVVRGLAERAQQTGHLRHTHQLILLYTAGHLGAEGAAFLHRTIAHCRNYEPRICQGYIDRLEPAHPPISCRRIREWLEEEGETGLCTCAHTRRTPMELCPNEPPETGEMEASTRGKSLIDAQGGTTAKGKRPRRDRPAPAATYNVPALEATVWADVAGDLFSDTQGAQGELPLE